MVELPIGVFDSGVGGLTVVAALRRELPAEEILYLGDTARVPYGSKSPETVARYAQRCAAFLLDQGIKLLMVACNTASAFALDALRATLPVPVLGAVEPGAREAVATTRTGVVGVLGTLGTVQSGAYPRAIAALDPAVRTVARACPLLVPLAEEGWVDDEIARAVAARYLGPLLDQAPGLDVLLLGCTHYPLLRGALEAVLRGRGAGGIALVDSAGAMARAGRTALAERGLLRPAGAGGARYVVTDDARFAEVGARFLGGPLGDVARVDL